MNFQSIGAPVRENGGVFTAAHDPLYPSSAKTIVFTDEKAPENFAFSCEIKLCGDGEAGMYFRAQGKNGATWIVGYFFSVNAVDGSVKISKINGGDRDNAVLGHMRYPFEKGVWYNMRVEMRGTHARLWFDNFKLDADPYPKYDMTLRHFSRGVCGLDLGGGAAEFREVKIEAIEAEPAWTPDNSYRNPVVYGADPDILFHDGTYYLYFTDTQDMSLFQCYTSKDLIHWSEPVVVFHGKDGWGNNEYMSPNVICKDGLFYMFYASHTAPDPVTGKREAHVAFASSASHSARSSRRRCSRCTPTCRRSAGIRSSIRTDAPTLRSCASTRATRSGRMKSRWKTASSRRSTTRSCGCSSPPSRGNATMPASWRAASS